MKRALITGVALGLLVAAATACGDQAPTAPTELASVATAAKPLERASLASAPKLALLANRYNSGETHLIVQSLDSAKPNQPLATFAHVRGGSVQARPLPGGAFAVVLDRERSRDNSFAAVALHLDRQGKLKQLASSVVHASVPHPVDSDRIVIETGNPGPSLTPSEVAAGRLRTDALSVDVVALSTGARRSVHRFNGYATHLCGVLRNEAIVYRVAFGGADLVAVDIDTGSVRTLVERLPAFARDFSVDPSRDALLYSNRSETGGMVVERLDLASGKRRVVHRAQHLTLAPAFLPGGDLTFNRPGAGTLVEVGATSASLVAQLERSRATPFPRLAVVQAATAARLVVPTPADHRVSIVGFMP